MITLHELAEYCGVSAATVSRALRDLPTVAPGTRLRIQDAAASLGYAPSPSAASLRSGRHRNIAIAAPPLGPWFYSRAIRGVEQVLHAEGYTFSLLDTAVQTDGSRLAVSRSSYEKRSDGVITLGIDLTAQEREDLHKVGKPVVVIGAPVSGLHTIGIDDRQAAGMAMRHLLDLGHRRIAHLGGDNDYCLENAVGVLRRQAWAAALSRAGLPAEQHLFVSGDFLLPAAKRAAATLLESKTRPTAIFASSDVMAFGVLLVAHELGLAVPRDLSVIGIDDHPWSSSFGLTTVHQDPFEQGVLAAQTLLGELERRRPPVRKRAPMSLVVRASTGRPRC